MSVRYSFRLTFVILDGVDFCLCSSERPFLIMFGKFQTRAKLSLLVFHLFNCLDLCLEVYFDRGSKCVEIGKVHISVGGGNGGHGSGGKKEKKFHQNMTPYF